MNSIKSQKGVGLIEVLVALLLLGVGVLGFVALQYRAVESTSEAINRVQAINIARDMAERIRVNRDAIATYKAQTGTAANQSGFTTNCITTDCTAVDLADFDVSQVAAKAATLGMTINMLTCSGNSNGRNCIYVAWGDTSPTDGSGTGHCTNGSTYNSASTCLIMETY